MHLTVECIKFITKNLENDYLILNFNKKMDSIKTLKYNELEDLTSKCRAELDRRKYNWFDKWSGELEIEGIDSCSLRINSGLLRLCLEIKLKGSKTKISIGPINIKTRINYEYQIWGDGGHKIENDRRHLYIPRDKNIVLEKYGWNENTYNNVINVLYIVYKELNG